MDNLNCHWWKLRYPPPLHPQLNQGNIKIILEGRRHVT
jgi:hypothetical protein